VLKESRQQHVVFFLLRGEAALVLGNDRLRDSGGALCRLQQCLVVCVWAADVRGAGSEAFGKGGGIERNLLREALATRVRSGEVGEVGDLCGVPRDYAGAGGRGHGRENGGGAGDGGRRLVDNFCLWTLKVATEILFRALLLKERVDVSRLGLGVGENRGGLTNVFVQLAHLCDDRGQA
jgi:hypothetical protein